MNVLGAVLAGGPARRMGRDKALLDWEGTPLAVRVVNRLREALGEVVVVAKRTRPLEELGLRVVADPLEVQTPLAGILAALREAGGRPVFVVACDMPFVNPSLVRRIVELAEGYEAGAPVKAGRLEPLHALWGPQAEPAILHSIEAGDLAAHRVLERLELRRIEEPEWRPLDPGGRSFANANTPQDLEKLRGDRAIGSPGSG
ncbi:MAG: molybdenum cofactor guanylyltransferase [Actinomycetota bacterium]